MLIGEIVEIKEFRGIKELAESLPLKKFNVLIGKNNSGKSALLEALFLAVGFITNRTEIRDPSKKLPFEIMSKNSGLIPTELITGMSILKFLESRHRGLQSLIYKYAGVAKVHLLLSTEHELLIKLNDKRGIIQMKGPQIKRSESFPFHEVLYFPYDTNFVRRIDQFLEVKETLILKREIHTKTAKLVSDPLDEKFTEIVLKKDGWYLRREDASYIHIDDVGDGLKKVVRAIMSIELIKPGLILWDGFDTSLHPSMIRMLLKWLARGNWQVVIATHSIDVLYYLADLNEELDDFDAQIILLRKDQKDVLHHKELNMGELEDLLEGNVDPRMLVDVLKI